MSEKNLVYEVESDILQHSSITKLSYRVEFSYFTGRAGIIRLISLFLSLGSVGLLFPGFFPGDVERDEDNDADMETASMMNNKTFTGYGDSAYTYAAISLGGCTILISLVFIVLLILYMEVRCELVWERVNQKFHVLACILSVSAAFCDIMSIQEIQVKNCQTERCGEEFHNIKVTRHEQLYYPPHFISHYVAFVGFLSNAMLYSIASRIWLRNSDY